MSADDELHRRVARRIRQMAAQRRVKISHLPLLAAVSAAHFFDILALKKSPTLRWLGDVAAALDCDAAELLRPDDQDPPPSA